MSILAKLQDKIGHRGWLYHGDVIKNILRQLHFAPYDDAFRCLVEDKVAYIYGDTIRVVWDMTPGLQPSMACSGSPLEGRTIYFLL